MTNKQAHLLAFWRAKLKEVQTKEGRPVSAGEVAKHVSQSRKTAQKYLDMLAEEKVAFRGQKQYPNKIWGITYELWK